MCGKSSTRLWRMMSCGGWSWTTAVLWRLSDAGCGRGNTLPVARVLCCVFFFQAEDGIRDVAVTGVQTCALPIYDVGLSVRSVNSLKNSNIRTLGDLVQYREEDLLKVKNVGEKALGEIAELLRREGPNFGLKVEEGADEPKVVAPGGAPQAPATEGDPEQCVTPPSVATRLAPRHIRRR